MKMLYKVEYVWIGKKNTYTNFYSKIRTIECENIKLENIPKWNFDGSSTGQNIKDDETEITLIPVRLYDSENGIKEEKMVLCECYYIDGKNTKCNTRVLAKNAFNDSNDECWFGLEQEYVLMDGDKPLGWPKDGYPESQGIYYCSHGKHMKGRYIVMEHYNQCINAGIKIAGINAEVMPSQWEYQIGPCDGLKVADDLIMARFLYQKLAEKYNLWINYHPKPISGPWNGSGCHMNFSTKNMREENGYKIIEKFVKFLSSSHEIDMHSYGKDNEKRLLGLYETSNINLFSFGVGTRHTSVRIPYDTFRNLCGYFEDRRPASNIDPYLITSQLYKNYVVFKHSCE